MHPTTIKGTLTGSLHPPRKVRAGGAQHNATRALARLVVAFLGLAAAACCKKTPPPQTPVAVLGAQTAVPGAPPTTKQACDACAGKWARHGLADAESCICKTRDG